MTDSSWFAGTFEGAELEAHRASAAATPQQRWDWLLAALELAQESGALARCRREEDDRLLADWQGG